MKAMAVAALIALVSVTSTQSPAQSPHGRSPRGGEGMMAMLDLDSATAVKIAKMRDEHRKDRIALRAKLETARVDFRAAMRREPVDEKTALARQKEMASIREKMQTSALEHRFAVAKLLTPDQRKMLKEHLRGRWMSMDDGFDGEMGDGHHGDGPMKHGRGRNRGMERDDD